MHPDNTAQNLAAATCAALRAADPEQKCVLTERLWAAWQAGELRPADAPAAPLPVDRPGRPHRPALVHPRRLGRRSLHTPAGRRLLVHALAHIEFNAVNLALDAAHRFAGLPADYYRDWLRVAAEEAKHFRLLQERLRNLGSDYGAYPAHDGLWDMARRTAHDPLARMALVPRVLEARGLDVTPAMMDKLRRAGDPQTAAILAVILRDEVEHVNIGSRWFRHLCRSRGLEPERTFRALIAEHFDGRLRGPFNRPARLQAGFSAAELDRLDLAQD